MDRELFSEAAAEFSVPVEAGSSGGYLCATTLITVYYLAGKALGAKRTKQAIQKLLVLFEVAPANRPALETARQAYFRDRTTKPLSSLFCVWMSILACLGIIHKYHSLKY